MNISASIKFLVIGVALILSACRGESVTVVRDIPPAQMADYLALVPDLGGITASATPQIAVVGSMAGGDYYLEGVVQIRVTFDGVDYWWPIHQPLNNQIGYDTGIPLGYPKVVQPMCHTDDGSYYTFSFGSCWWWETPEIKIHHTTTNRIETTHAEAPDLSDGTAGLLTLSEDGCLLNSGPTYANPDTGLILREGSVYLENNSTRPWAHLLPTGDYGVAVLATSEIDALEEGQADPNSDVDNPFYPIYELACGY